MHPDLAPRSRLHRRRAQLRPQREHLPAVALSVASSSPRPFTAANGTTVTSLARSGPSTRCRAAGELTIQSNRAYASAQRRARLSLGHLDVRRLLGRGDAARGLAADLDSQRPGRAAESGRRDLLRVRLHDQRRSLAALEGGRGLAAGDRQLLADADGRQQLRRQAGDGRDDDQGLRRRGRAGRGRSTRPPRSRRRARSATSTAGSR